MPEISFEESLRQIRDITDRVERSKKAKDWAGALAASRQLLEHPCAHHQVVVHEVWDDLFEFHKRMGDFDAAIAAKQEAVRSGYRSQPHPDADIAECHLLAGRRVDADALFADLRTRTPDDVWLYNSAGFSFAEIADHGESARWFRDGIEVALSTGDPDRVVSQLLDGLRDAWAALGQTPEQGLVERVDGFVDTWVRPTARLLPRWDDAPAMEQRRCAHCGYDPDGSAAPVLFRSGDRFEGIPDPSWGRSSSRLPSSAVVALAWFPSGEWEKATGRWPDLLEDLPAGHVDYSHRIEARLKQLTRRFAGHPMRVSPLTVDGLVSYCAQRGEDPGTGEARSSYAADMASHSGAISWPPGRNARCWCGSGRKYKACCGPIPMAKD